MGLNLYHYCSIETFIAIIKNKNLRLSDLSKTNDFMERKWILNLIEDSLVQFFAEKNVNINLREEYYYDEGVYNHIDYILSEIDLYIKNPCFITCFSMEGDLLSQWRAYADDGRGLSIGFDSELLDKVGQRKSKVLLDEVIYKKEDQIDEILYAAEKAFLHANKVIKLFLDCYGESDDNFDKVLIEEFESFGEVFAQYISKASYIIKNPAFAEEKEFRIYYTSDIYKDMEEERLKEIIFRESKFNNYVLEPLDFFTRNNQIIGYMNLSFKKLIDRNIIKEIIIGPSSKVTKEDVRHLLIKYGFDLSTIKIIKSRASYQIK